MRIVIFIYSLFNIFQSFKSEYVILDENKNDNTPISSTSNARLKYEVYFRQHSIDNKTICYNKKIDNSYDAKIAALTTYLSLGLNSSQFILIGDLNRIDLNNLTKLFDFLNGFDHHSNSSAEQNGEIFIKNEALGARLYVMLLLIIFAIIISILLISTVRPAIEKDKQRKHDTIKKPVDYLFQVHEHHTTKNILEKLKDQDYRDRLWSIYRGTSNENGSDRSVAKNSGNNRKLLADNENRTLRDIERRIEMLQKYRKNMEEKSLDYLDLKNTWSIGDTGKSNELKNLDKKIGVHKRPNSIFKYGGSLFGKFSLGRYQEKEKLKDIYREWSMSNFTNDSELRHVQQQKRRRTIQESTFYNLDKNYPKQLSSPRLGKLVEYEENEDRSEIFPSEHNKPAHLVESNKSYYFTVSGASFQNSAKEIQNEFSKSNQAKSVDALGHNNISDRFNVENLNEIKQEGRFRISKSRMFDKNYSRIKKEEMIDNQIEETSNFPLVICEVNNNNKEMNSNETRNVPRFTLGENRSSLDRLASLFIKPSGDENFKH